MSKWDRAIEQICEGVKPTMTSKSMSRYIDADELTNFFEPFKDTEIPVNALLGQIENTPTADVVEVGIITCLGIKFVVEGDTIKVKWRHWDKHYIVPFGGLLELWEKYEEQEHEQKNRQSDHA